MTSYDAYHRVILPPEQITRTETNMPYPHPDILAWLDEHVKYTLMRDALHVQITFHNEEDATLAKLRWGFTYA